MSALLLIISLLLPFAQFAFGLQGSSDATLPVCCRAHGRHKCATSSLPRIGQPSRENSSPQLLTRATEKCPCPQGAVPAAHSDSLWNPGLGSAKYPVDVRYEPVETNGIDHVRSLVRANPKRGPPASSQIAL